MSKPQNIRQHMIERMAVLLGQKGLQGASFSNLLAVSGAPRGSLYHHFPGGKAELVLAAIEYASLSAGEVLETADKLAASEVAERFIAIWRTVLVRSRLGAGCGIAAVTVAADDDEVMAKAGAIFRNWRERLAQLLEEGGIDARRASALATTLIAACEGAVILARAEGSMDPFEEVALEQLTAIKAAMTR